MEKNIDLKARADDATDIERKWVEKKVENQRKKQQATRLIN